ncbi:hypothetical protein M413DRAFT_32110 [Hebeloma cylindrosporum]|uniref:Carboxylic ester hydrolase n=1 Tax=Hebeloma cylindrosporum TaxID=76867 RepID=A0A0C2Y468_HEBCY|nr:hypothetical protein M413DRAFT_32110 [Hebeloma cylindrosporum h7]
MILPALRPGFLLSLLSFDHFTRSKSFSAAPLVGNSVTLDYGTFNGLRNESTGIIYFRGIRFADPPLGDLRWKAPVVPPTKHLGVVDATHFGDICMQTTTGNVGSHGNSEDCLFGNVYIPIDTQVNDKLPVLVWFHGGGFQTGSSHGAPPELIMRSSAKPFIFISFEYRLGPFGFLGGADIKEKGGLNAGLLDQRGALRWVQRYISLFGGDKSQVTIWGQSAGAGSTMFQLIANGGDNEGLFHAAMGDSPSLSFCPPFDGPYITGIYQQFAGLAGCDNQGAYTLECLRSAPAEKLALAAKQVLLARPTTLFVFSPILDGDFITERPVEAFKSGNFARVPVLFGSNSDEGSGWSAGITDPSANTSMPNATEDTVFNFLRGQYATLGHASFDDAVNLYPLKEYSNSLSLQLRQMYGECRYICTAPMITGAAIAESNMASFQYHYDNPHLGSFHSAELGAFFGPSPNAKANDLALLEAMRQYWTSFVTTGQPSAKNGVAWKVDIPTLEAAGGPYVLLHPGGIVIKEMSADLTARCSFWHNLSPELLV